MQDILTEPIKSPSAGSKSASRKRKSSCEDSLLTTSVSSSGSTSLSTLSPTSSSSDGLLSSSISDFEATDIKWAYSDSVISDNCFKNEIYSSWRLAEAKSGLSPLFLESQKMGVTEKTRREVLLSMLRWRRNFDCTHETIHLAVYIFDKCLDSFQVDNALLRDVAAVALVLASKQEEYIPLKFSNVIQLELTTSRCPQFLGSLEKRALFEVNYMLSYPTPFMFMNYFHNSIQSSLQVVQMANYILELSMLSVKYRDFGGAFTAHAVVCLASGIIAGSSETRGDALAILLHTEEELVADSGIEIGSTRRIMRNLIGDILDSLIVQHEIWSEYATLERCEVANNIIPSELVVFLRSEGE